MSVMSCGHNYACARKRVRTSYLRGGLCDGRFSIYALAVDVAVGSRTDRGAEFPAAVGKRGTQGKTLIDYFLPMPIHGGLSKDVWGAPGVLPRDPQNGLEDPTIQKWDYWDGQIVKSPDGKFHLYASRWDHSTGHKGWTSSSAVHAVSDNVIGPYEDKGMLWPDNMGGKGHNVTALIMPDGRYAVTVSEIRPGEVFVSKSPDGPWESLGLITVKDHPSGTRRTSRRCSGPTGST